MGDKRNSSRDSRDPAIGLIDTREILGKAVYLIYPGTHGGLLARDFDRIGAVN
jgi:signal peptidase I